MKTKIAAVGTILALPILLAAAAAPTFAEADASVLAPQDTAQAKQAQPGARRGHGMRMGSGMGMQGMGRQGMRGMMGGIMGADHVGPRMLLGLKSELELTDDQVSRLEKIHEGHHALMQAQMENLQTLRESLQKARAARDWDAVSKAIDEGSRLRTGMAQGIVNVERQSWDVLSATQRETFDTWQEGARLFRQQRMRGSRQMRGRQMGMRRCRWAAPADSAQSQQ
ncbi:MAG: Spy/CpxP family protein refolding chaperone [Gemmatimonadota bacterium]